jgi:hypothetical protein
MTRSKAAVFYVLLFAFLFLVAEGASRVAVAYLSTSGIFFDQKRITQSYGEYLRVRDARLGWGPPPMSVDPFGARKDFSKYADSPPCMDVYGDSFTWGDEVSDKEAWATLSSDLLKCRVRNYGVPGYGTDQAYLRFLGAKDHSKVVFLDHLSENILRNVNQFRNFIAPIEQFGFKPRFVLHDGALSPIPLPSVPDGRVQGFLDHPELVLHDEFFLPNGSSGPISASFPYSWSLLKGFDNWMIRAKLAGRPLYSDFYSDAHPSHALPLTFAILSDFRSKAEALGLHPVVMIFPTCRDFSERKKHGIFPYAPLIGLLDRSSIPHLDIGALLQERRLADPRRLYVTCSGHLNPEGNRLVADIVSQYLHQEKLIVD